MSHYLAGEILSMLQGMAKADFAAQPSLVFMASLRKKLIFIGFSSLEAEQLVGAMDVAIPEGYVDADDLEAFAITYCEVIEKIRNALESHGFEHPMVVLLKMADQFSLKFE